MARRPMDEKQVLKKLDIPDFRHLSKDKAMQLASMISEMDPEVAKKALEQFPDFARSCTDALGEYKGVIEEAFKQSKEGAERVFAMCDAIMAALGKMLEEDDLTFEQRMAVVKEMKEVADIVALQEREHRHFVMAGAKYFAGGVITLAGVAAVVLGGKVDVSGIPGRLLKK